MTTKEKAAAVLKATKAGMDLPEWQSVILMSRWKDKNVADVIDRLYEQHCEGKGKC